MYHAATRLADGTLLVTFGYSATGAAMSSWEIFTPPQPITIIGPDPITVPATSPSRAVVTYPAVSVSDPNDASPTITFFPPPGRLFPIGTNYATIRVTDAEGGSNQAGIMITVTGPVTVTVDSSTVIYNGAPQGVTATTVPAGLATTTTYDGSTTQPTAAGSYAVVVTVTDPSYSGQGTGTLTISTAAQTITFPAIAPVAYGASPPTLAATASSGLPVSVSVLSGPATIVDGALVASADGTVVVAADQAGNADYQAAPEVAQTVIVAGQSTRKCGNGSGGSGVAAATPFLLLRLALRARPRRAA
jgi:hypothetical protein